MRNDIFRNTASITSPWQKMNIWMKVMSILACVAVVCAAYALILPVIALEKKPACPVEEHTHTDGCYTQVITVEKTVPVCTPESLAIHRHSDGCLDENSQRICGEADFVVHTHGESCYDENGSLWCTIPEKEAHTHSEICFEIPETHVHGEGCYQRERGELTCAESVEPLHTHGEGCYAPEKSLTCALEEVEGHVHSEGCYEENTALVCTLTESEGHYHGESCFDESGTLICALVEGDGHAHGEGCYEKSSTLTCPLTESEGHRHGEGCYEAVLTCTESTEPAHAHTDECYAWNDVLTCTESTDPGEPVRICGKEEILLHQHTQGCRETDEEGSVCLTCGQVQVLSHVHTAECFQAVEEPVDTEALTCRLEESENHRHSALCYGTWELSCNLEEHTHSGECSDLPQSIPLSEAPAADPAPLDLTGYIADAIMSYRVGADAEWQQVTNDTVLPGNAELKLEISYENVHVDALRDAGLQMTFTLPRILRSPTGSGQINDASNQKMGTMAVENSLVTLTFDEVWLNNHHVASSGVINGKFHVQSEIDLSLADGQDFMEITVGKVKISLNFEGDMIAHYADVTIQKSVPVAKQDDSGDYLEYTLTVTAGQDGAPRVVVKDVFQDQRQILGYVGVPEAAPTVSGAAPVETGAPDGKAGVLSMDGSTMEWTIGIMAPNETRTLTYRVKMKEGYLGGKVPEDPVVNTASLSCDVYARDDDTATFTPKAEATMSKTAGTYTPDPDGGGTITYTVWIHADETNNYTLTNVKIWDALDGSIGNNNATESKYLPYLSYVGSSFRLYNGGSEDQTGAEGLTGETSITPVFQENSDRTTNTHYFSCDAGALAPGESKTLIYTLHIDPGVFPAAGNNTPKIHNRAQIHAGDSTKGNETALNSFNETVDIQKKVWSRKHKGVEQTADTTVSVSGSVYGADGGLIVDPPAEFTAPAGSYKYTVTVNEAADWDVSKASMTDRLVGGYSTYIGYVRVDAYSADASGNKTLANTVWLSVDGRTEFTFTPSEIGLTGNQSYTLTYYTHVEIPAGAPQINVENGFTMTGNVGIGAYSYVMAGAYASASNMIQGSNSFSVSKHGWYYEPSKVPEGEPYENGAIYWYIQVDGSVIPADTYLRDVTAWNSQYMYDGSSLVGLFTGNPGEGSVAAYDDLEDLLSSGKLTRLASGYSYEITRHKEGGKDLPYMTVHLTESVRLNEGESLFLIVKIMPHKNPAGLAGDAHYSYQNGVESSYNGSNWVSWGANKSMVIYGSNGISKTLEKVSTWNGTTETVVSPEDAAAVPEALAGLESGTYVSWNVQLNYTGRLHGSYCVEETIPNGMKLAYVECIGVGSGYTVPPSCPQKALDGWTESQRAGAIATYYYTNGQIAQWYVDGLQTDDAKHTHTVDFRVVCRVTDGDVLLGGTEKAFQNQVRLLREGGRVIDSSVSAVSLQSHTLKKEGTYNNDTPTLFPFVITLNPLGEDLVPGADTISLLDTLGNNLKLDLSSIRVTETGTDTQITDYTSSVNGQTLTLTLPDQRPLTVTYSAWIIAKPGDRIEISNNAHWEGYPTPLGGGVHDDNFEFDISGSAGSNEPPSIQITKLDANDLSLPLKGAEFTLTGTVEQAGGTDVEISWTGSTNENGKLTFSTAGDQTMKFNTVYCLRETKAPDGYVMDSESHYFVIAKKVPTGVGTEAYPAFPENVYVHYLGPAYSYQALNRKYTPELPETGGIGATVFYVVGSVLLSGAAVALLRKKRVSAGA